MKKTKILILGILLKACLSYGQDWHYNALNQGINGNNLGTSDNFSINIYTNNLYIARFTSSLALTTPWDFNGGFSGSGHGLNIQTSSLASGNLD